MNATECKWRRTALTRADGAPVPDDWCLVDPQLSPIARVYRRHRQPARRSLVSKVAPTIRHCPLVHFKPVSKALFSSIPFAGPLMRMTDRFLWLGEAAARE